ncbi:MAG: acyltransferase domain-containing protein [Rubrivivax sp.]
MLGLLQLRLGSDWRERLADADWAASNQIAQPLLTGLGLAAWQSIQARLPAPAAIAGYSVGELAAFSVAGVFDAEQAMSLAVLRAAAMDRSAAGQDTGLLAVAGVGQALLGSVSKTHRLATAIHLAEDHKLLGGKVADLIDAESALSAAGAQCKLLPVRIASHTPQMAAAAADMSATLATIPFLRPRTALVCNRSGGAECDPQALKTAFAEQIANPVLWDRCMDAIAERRVNCVLEIGPGNTLSRWWNKRHPAIAARSIDDFRSADAIVAWVAAVLARA